jgi:hypothetical protein
VQQPYDLAVSDRFSVTAGPTYNAWILKGDKPFSAGSGTGPRTAMRWGNWSGVEHMWEADVLIDSGTTGAAIMQVKINDGFESVYVNVKGNGDLYGDSNHTVLASGVWGVWFHLVCGYDPVSGNGRASINGGFTTSPAQGGGALQGTCVSEPVNGEVGSGSVQWRRLSYFSHRCVSG